MPLTKVEKNHIRLVNQLSKSFIKAFPVLKNNKAFKPIRMKDYK